MEQWQFLIQKEGERTWHPLDKSRVQIMEGRYRVVARSHRINTDVEVRVTHSLPNEIPPRRRVQKRRRRSNTEGLTAVIPFTYLKAGIWELQCSGDLMSDLLGASWQYTVILEVIPSGVKGKKVLTTSSSKNLDKQYKVSSKEIQTNQASSKITNDLNSNDAELISSISVEPLQIKSANNTAGKIISTASKSELKGNSDQVVKEKPAQKLRESLQAKKADKQKKISQKPVKKSTQKSLATDNKPSKEKHSQKQPDLVKTIPENVVNASLEKKPSEKPLATENKQKSLEKSKVSNQVVPEKPKHQGNLAIIEQTASPVRVKGDTAEQILQNLMELALPSSESLLADQTVEDTPIPAPLPLMLTLDRVNYVARWGENITLDAVVQLKETTKEQIKQIFKASVQIELRSPHNSELLQSVRQPNPNKSLPFAIASSIDIPPSCDSKLILGEIKVYGAVSSNGVVKLLGSQSFTITAEITELLAITVANPQAELDRFGYSTEELSAANASEMIDSTVSLDLELFNLVKTAKPQQSLVEIPLTKKSLPPRIDPRRFRTGVRRHYLKLPNVPGYQEKIDRYINDGHIETVRSSNITNTSFPYLRKLKALPSSNVEVDGDVYQVEESKYLLVGDDQNIAETSAETDNTSQAELIVDQQKKDNYFEFEEPVILRSSEFIITENTNTSPLIRQWMLSQGNSLPEPIDVDYEDYDIEASNQNISQQQSSLTPKTETNDNSQTLNREKVQEVSATVSSKVSSNINVQATSSPYFSISTSSQWEINQHEAPSTQIAQEFVVEDTDNVTDNTSEAQSSQPDEPIDNKKKNSSTITLTTNTQEIEQLPTPQLYVPQGELISGKSLNLRVRLPEGNSHLAVKLWVEDCQTRYLLDGPHLLTNLTPNNKGELEVITKLDIPFGCLEIRLEAIAINRTTQQESYKFTIQRTVIPPDLPKIQLDAILGM